MDEQDIFQELGGCEICHQAPPDRSENPNSRICTRCRNIMIHYPIPKIFYPIALAVLLLTILAYVRMPESLSDYRIYATAEDRINDGMLYDTLTRLMEVTERHPNSADLPVRLVTLAMEYGCYDFSAYCMNTYLAGKSLSDTTYGNMIHYQNILNSYYDTVDELQAVSDKLGEDTPSELATIVINDKLEEMKQDPGMYQPLIWYYLGQFSDDLDESIACFQKALEENPMDFSARSELGTRFRRKNDLETARFQYEQILHYEKTDAQACRGMAILALLNDHPEEALTYIRTAYESNPDSTYVRETYLITLSANGLTEEMTRLRQEMTDAGTPVEEDTEALLSGETTLREYYIEEEYL